MFTPPSRASETVLKGAFQRVRHHNELLASRKGLLRWPIAPARLAPGRFGRFQNFFVTPPDALQLTAVVPMGGLKKSTAMGVDYDLCVSRLYERRVQ